jgi:F0F1-type ATP synthase assembly protein I
MRDDRSSDPKSAPHDKDDLNLRSLAGVGLQFAVSILLFLFLGQWADRKLGSTPAFTLVGVFIGGGAAFYSMYRRVTAAQKADDERRKQGREGKG